MCQRPLWYTIDGSLIALIGCRSSGLAWMIGPVDTQLNGPVRVGAVVGACACACALRGTNSRTIIASVEKNGLVWRTKRFSHNTNERKVRVFPSPLFAWVIPTSA